MVRVSAARKPDRCDAAFMGVDVVREAVDRFRVAIVPLQRDFNVDAVLRALHEDRRVVHDRLVLVQVRDELADAALVVESVALAFAIRRSFLFALIVKRDDDAAVEEGELAKAVGERVEAESNRLEDLRVGLEANLGAAALGRAGDHELGGRLPALVALLVDLTDRARSRDRASRRGR